MMTENNEMESGEAQLQRSPSTASIQPVASKASTRSSELLLSFLTFPDHFKWILKTCSIFILKNPLNKRVHLNFAEQFVPFCSQKENPSVSVTCVFL